MSLDDTEISTEPVDYKGTGLVLPPDVLEGMSEFLPQPVPTDYGGLLAPRERAKAEKAERVEPEMGTGEIGYAPNPALPFSFEQSIKEQALYHYARLVDVGIPEFAPADTAGALAEVRLIEAYLSE